MTKRTLLAATLSVAFLAPPAFADGHEMTMPPARTSANASCVGALSTIFAQMRMRHEINEQQQGAFLRMLAKVHGTTELACLGPHEH